jgi:homopolymeric O-antigen transport system permease protein
MPDVQPLPIAPLAGPATLVIRPSTGLLGRDVRNLWPYRELAFFLTWRDIKVRYRQSVLGAAWAIIQPVLMMVVFSVVFGHYAKLPSNGLPYPVFTFAALVPFTYFTSALSGGASSLLSNSNLVSKVYFPRLLIPISATIGPLVDFFIAMVVLAIMIAAYGASPSIGLVTLPALMVLAFATALGAGTLLAAMNVRYRDFQYVVPFLVQILLYATPVAYSAELVPKSAQNFLGLNPMATVVAGFRWGLLGTAPPSLLMVSLSVIVAVVFIIAGLLYFQRVEKTFADII